MIPTMPKHYDMADYHAIKQPLVGVRVSQTNMKHVARLPGLILPIRLLTLVFACVHLPRLASSACCFGCAPFGSLQSAYLLCSLTPRTADQRVIANGGC